MQEGITMCFLEVGNNHPPVPLPFAGVARMVEFCHKGEYNGVFFIGKEPGSDIRIVGEGKEQRVSNSYRAGISDAGSQSEGPLNWEAVPKVQAR